MHFNIVKQRDCGDVKKQDPNRRRRGKKRDERKKMKRIPRAYSRGLPFLYLSTRIYISTLFVELPIRVHATAQWRRP